MAAMTGLVLVLGWAGVSSWVNRHLYPEVLQLAESRLQAVATETVSRGLLEALAGRGYQSVMRVATTQDGTVSYLALDAMAAGRLEMEAAIRVQRSLNNLRGTQVRVPLGELTGIRLLGARGPSLAVQLLPVGNIVVRLDSAFEDAGINQTLHRLSLVVKATLCLVLPRAERQVQWTFVQPLGETLVVGKVPEVYAALAGPGLVTTVPLGTRSQVDGQWI